MPQFFFHDEDGHRYITDTEGTELSDSSAAADEAVRHLGRLLMESGGEFRRAGDHRSVTVTDGTGLVLYSVTVIGTRAPDLG